MDSIANVLFRLRGKGVRVWVEGDQLRYQSPRGALASDEVDVLRARKDELMAFLQPTSRLETEPPMQPRQPAPSAPLTFCQSWLWNLYDLGRCHSTRSVSGAMRLLGPLDVRALSESFHVLVLRHEALRTRIIVAGDAVCQWIDSAVGEILEVIDLTKLRTSDHRFEALRLARCAVREPVSVAVGPLFAARLLKLNDIEHVLIVALEHMVSDGTSVDILWRELFTLYGRAARGLPLSLMPLIVQFADYAVWQRETNRVWEERHSSYWDRRLAGVQRLRLFADNEPVDLRRRRWAVIPVRLGSSLSGELREWSRLHKTTLTMSIFTAYVALISRWSRSSDVVVLFLTTGRVRPELVDMIGFFGHPLFLRIEVRERDTFLDLLGQVIQEYTLAYEHDDAARILTRIPLPEIARNPAFSWNSNPLEAIRMGVGDSGACTGTLRVENFDLELTPREDMDWDGEPRMDLSDTEGEITGSLKYRSDRLRPGTIERFGRDLRRFLEQLVQEPMGTIPDATRDV